MNHVHDILNLLKQNPKGFTSMELIAILTEEYGSNATFTTCGDHCLNHVEAIHFVLQKNKAVYENGRIYINSAIESC